MVRVFLKGGVWKNSEDEILKAAVMKYGKHQWARVASLLNRKSAKQCKARWHEWLDPSVRKMEWSRQEEEKLLHLAKLMPAQWKTIAPLVQRTAAQCQEHYEKLLDEAAASTTATSASAAAGAGSSTDGLRSASQVLRPGQIDSHPETNPARPDPIDMDEDEIEMLQEARARLANTQGKKAKRKAREKILAQAKRLADLQKRRELKQAGLLSGAAAKRARHRRRDIDLGVEIPFYKPAPAGFHDTTAEDERGEALRQKRWKAADYQQFNEQQYRSRDREAAMAQKREQARLRGLEKANMEYVVAQVNKANDPSSSSGKPIRSIGPMQLPQPQIQDHDLMQISKLQQRQQQQDMALLGDAGSTAAATKALLGDYSDRPLPTPMRNRSSASATPAAATQQSILRQASQLRMLHGQTPLFFDSDNNDNHTSDVAPMLTDDDDDDMTKNKKKELMGTPMPDRGGIGQTPQHQLHRDQLGLNRRPQSELRSDYGGGDDAASVGASTFATASIVSIKELAREERRAAKRARKELEEALAALPAPQFEYELAAPPSLLDDDDATTATTKKFRIPTDAADIEAAERERLRQEANKLYEARSTVVKRRELPRPLLMGAALDQQFATSLNKLAFDGNSTKQLRDETEVQAERMVLQEMFTLLQHDAHAFPVETPPEWANGGPGNKKKGDGSSSNNKKRKKDRGLSSIKIPDAPLVAIPEDLLKEAKVVVQKEHDLLVQEKVESALQMGVAQTEAEAMDTVLVHHNVGASHAGGADYVFVSSNGGGWQQSRNSELMEMESLRLEFETFKDAAASLRKRNDKLESKMVIKNGGYVKRADTIKATIQQTTAELEHSRMEESIFENLQRQEQLGGQSRCERLEEEISQLQQEEATAQRHYGDLLVERKRLLLLQKRKS